MEYQVKRQFVSELFEFPAIVPSDLLLWGHAWTAWSKCLLKRLTAVNYCDLSQEGGAKGLKLSPTSPLWFPSSILFPITHFWCRALFLSALCTPEWSRCKGDESMTSFNPPLHLSYEGEFLGLQPKVILHFWGNIEKLFPFLLHLLSRKNNVRLNRIVSIYHKCSCIPNWTSAQGMRKCSSYRAVTQLLYRNATRRESLKLSGSWAQAQRQQLYSQDTQYHILLHLKERISPELMH